MSCRDQWEDWNKELEKIIDLSFPDMFISRHVYKQSSRGFLKKRCFENIQQIYRRNAISIKLQSNFIETALQHGCSPVNLLHNFRKPFPKNTSGWLLLYVVLNLVDFIFSGNTLWMPQTAFMTKQLSWTFKWIMSMKTFLHFLLYS